MLTKPSNQPSNPIISYATLALLLALGLWLRLRFVHTVQLYPDEFVTLLAVQMIGQKGAPLMPSGLFYDHGLLFSYLGSLAALFGPAQVWVRYASLLFGMLTLGLTYFVGRRWFSPAVGLIAMAGLVIAPTAIQWSGRARMYALLQLLVLLTLWLAYEGIISDKARLRWLALLTYLGATLTHFAAVTLAPALVLGGIVLWWLHRGAGEISPPLPRTSAPLHFVKQRRLWLEALAVLVILTLAFLVKRAGQPKGIDALDNSNALPGLVEVFNIYSDFSFNLAAGWEAIAPFYLTLPALIFVPFVVMAMVVGGREAGRLEGWKKLDNLAHSPTRQLPHSLTRPLAHSPTLFLSLILLTTTLEIILLVSPDRRDAKYVFMLLPVLLLLGAQGMAVLGRYWLLVISNWVLGDNQPSAVSRQPSAVSSQPLAVSRQQLADSNHSPRTTHYALRTTPLLITVLILLLTKPEVDTLLANPGDDYETAFAYVQEHWQAGDTILTGTPTAAALYLGHNDFYGVQRRGGYDYRLLTVDNQAVDRWLASPAIRTEAGLHQTLAQNKVWLILERWGLQREYYDLPFQQQLLAQTEHVPEAQAQGIFVLRSKPDPQPLAVKPAHSVEANFDDLMRLTGYTVEPVSGTPGQPLRLTLYWQALAPLAHDYTVFVHLRQPQGGNVAQADHRPLDALYPTTLWPVGETIRESSDLFLPPDLPPGEYVLWAGLYLFETGERLPVQVDISGEHAVKLGVLPVGQ